MKTRMVKTVVLCFSLIVGTGFIISQKETVRDDLKTIYEQANVEGSFVLFDENKNEWIYCNHGQSNQGFIPASTF